MVGALLSLMLNFMTMGIHVVSKSSPAIRWVTSGSHPSWRRMLGVGALSNSVNNTAALQSTPNSALGINAKGGRKGKAQELESTPIREVYRSGV